MRIDIYRYLNSLLQGTRRLFNSPRQYNILYFFIESHLLTKQVSRTVPTLIYLPTYLPIHSQFANPHPGNDSSKITKNPIPLLPPRNILNFITLYACLQSHFWADSVDRSPCTFLSVRTNSLLDVFQP